MAQLTRTLLLPLLVLAGSATHGLAQVPKIGAPYVDKSDLGFHVKVPAGWVLIPPNPDDKNLIAKFDPALNTQVDLGIDPKTQYPVYVDLHCWLIKFDRRPQPVADPKSGVRRINHAAKDLQEWMKQNVGGDRLKLDGQKDFTADKIAATEYQFIEPVDPKLAVRYYAAVYKLKPDVDVAILFNAPGDPKKWNKWEGPFDTMSRSFGVEATKEVVGSVAQGDTLRDKKRAELTKGLAALGGWKLYETPNYFVVTDHTDKAFIQELQQRLEAIHSIYEQDYPAAKAEEFRKAGAGARTGDAKDDQEAARDKAMKDLLNDGADPKEASKCSVVRVFTNEAAYHSYGGPGSSAGYWAPMHKELVLYDDQAGGGRNDTWIVLNHEAFHQYIFYFYGNISPHSWYNEGTGDYYSGFFWKNGRFILERNKWRKDTIAVAVRTKSQTPATFCPLDVFVRWDQGEYYGSNELELGGGANYAQGWSFIYFLRTGKKNNAKGWNTDWDPILETYLRVLATSGKLDQAVEEAFKGVDMAALQQAWIDYTK